MRVLNLLAQIKLQKSPADLADLRRQNTNSKTTITAIISQPSPTCLSLRNNAACCIPLRDLRNLRENNTEEDSINIPRRNPKCLSLIYADKTQNNKTALTSPICLSLRNNAACCIRLRHLRHLRENNTQTYSIYCTN